MKNQPDRPVSKPGNKARDLRRQAETLLEEQRPTGREPADLKSTIQELQVHKIELELQNQELQRAHLEAELARSKYFDLYDLAPVGYATLNPRGEILEINLTGGRLLGEDRGRLMKRRFQLFVSSDDIPGFNHFLEKVNGTTVRVLFPVSENNNEKGRGDQQ